MSNRRRIQKLLEAVIGAVSLYASQFATLFFFYFVIKRISGYEPEKWVEYFILLTASFMIVFICFSSPINLLKRSKPMEFMSTARNCSITYALFAVLLILFKNNLIQSRYMFVFGFTLYFAFSLIGRYILKKFMLNHISGTKLATMTGVITTLDRAENFIPRLQLDWSKNVKAIALIDAKYENGQYKCPLDFQKSKGKAAASKTFDKERYKTIESICSVPVVANSENLIGWIRTASLDEVYINLPYDESFNVTALIEEIEDMGIVVNVNIPSMEKIVESSKFDNFNCIVKSGYPMVTFSPNVHDSTMLAIKRIIDIIGSIIGGIISIPIILITAIPLLIESPGPLIFKQQRVGKNGRLFNIFKIRSMYVDAEERKKALMEENKMDGHMFKVDNDPRITRVGRVIRKLSIDELPQFWNVLRGDMSLVGTRPPTVDEFEQYENHHKRRLSMKPGITGNWQVSGRSNIQDFEEVVKLDCEYIDNWSLTLDAKILLKTVGVVLTHKGAE